MKTLIIVDMQNDFIDGSLANPAAQAILPDMAEYIKNFDGQILFTRDTHEANYLLTQEGKNLPIKHCINRTSGWEVRNILLDAVACNRYGHDGVQVNKTSFGDVDALEHLISSVVDEIYLCGTCTDICVISVALNLKARFPEAKMYCIADLCAGVSPESHEAALTVMKMCQIEVI